ncbi:IS66 family insertion sequence element accessory protein TnpB [Corallococcus sp. M34]|nr:IS66 family insertion sequence element accessory protein TnpB [Citreicoccus inhibens]
MHKSIDGLMVLVKSVWSKDVDSGHLFAFISRRGACSKVLRWGRRSATSRGGEPSWPR